MSVNLEQAEGVGFGKEMAEPPPHPCKPKDASSATVPARPSFSNSLRVGLRIDIYFRCVLHGESRAHMVLTLPEHLYIYGRDGTFFTICITPVLYPLKVSRTSSSEIAKP